MVMFEQHDQSFPEIGINIRILQTGQSNAYYHSENQQEEFLVLGGECKGTSCALGLRALPGGATRLRRRR